jgi:hypothetical protein
MSFFDNSSAFPRGPAPLDLAGRLRLGRCFRTTADGRIAIADDGPRLFDRLRAFDRMALQARHTSARLIAVGPPPALVWDASGEDAADADGALRLHLPASVRPWARIAPCACCGSPGRIELRNRHDLDFLQVCALPGCPLDCWSDAVADLVQPSAAVPRSAPESVFPRLDGTALRLHATPRALPRLLTGLAEQGVAIRVALRTAEVTHARVFVPEIEDDEGDGGLLTVREATTVLQLALPAVRGFAIDGRDESRPLHVVGTHDAVLLTLSAAPCEAPAWREALFRTFPFLA